MNMKYNEPILLSIHPLDYCVFEDGMVRPDNHIPRNPIFDTNVDENDERTHKYCGGVFNWGLHTYPEIPQENTAVKLQLMRLWVTTMYTQMASGLSYTNELDSNIKVHLTEEELNTLSDINRKISKGIFNEIFNIESSFIKKTKIKKVDL
jgi:hypothetical protein